MDETSSKPKKAKEHWKQKRSRSTSSLLAVASVATVNSESDNSGKEGDSDDAQRSFAKLSLQTGKPRRRRYKRMAIDYITEIETQDEPHLFKEPYQTNMHDGPSQVYGPHEANVSEVSLPVPSASGANHHHTHHKKHKKKVSPFLSFDLDTGKRKRSGRDKSIEPPSFPLASCSSEFQSMIGIGMDLMNVDNDDNELMDESDGDDVSSLSSGSESGSLAPSCDEGGDGDDEQSDWVGDEWKDEMGESDRRALILRRLRDYVPSREIRAGKRRVYPEIPPFSMRTYANEQVSKFLQDPGQSQLRLHPMRQDERVQLSHIAYLYSLQLNSDEVGGCIILTKTSNTTQMTAGSPDRAGYSKSMPTENARIESESDSKRIKKSDCH